jgi:hypothetical protein
MGKRGRKSTQIQIARKDAAQRQRVALKFQAPEIKRPGPQATKGLSA